MGSVSFVSCYLATLSMCGLLTLIMGKTMSRSTGGLREVRYFHTLTWVVLLIIVSEGIWSLNRLPSIQLSGNFMRLLSFINLSASVIGTMCIYCFGCANFVRMGILKENKYHVYIKNIPATLMIIFNGISFWKGYTYTVDANGIFVAGPFYALQLFICLGYLAATIALSLFVDIKTKHTHRMDLMRLINTSLIVSLGGIGQVLISEAPIVSICNALAMTYLNVSLLQANVTTDALTGLTNRARMNTVLKEKFDMATQRPFTLYLADVDSFKKINDTYGHQEGDEALKRVANAFRAFGKNHRSVFVARYGGDEFVLTVDKQDNISEEQLEKELQQLVDIQQKKSQANYKITMCLGGHDVISNTEKKEIAIQYADDKMYQKKQIIHSRGENK